MVKKKYWRMSQRPPTRVSLTILLLFSVVCAKINPISPYAEATKKHYFFHSASYWMMSIYPSRKKASKYAWAFVDSKFLIGNTPFGFINVHHIVRVPFPNTFSFICIWDFSSFSFLPSSDFIEIMVAFYSLIIGYLTLNIPFAFRFFSVVVELAHRRKIQCFDIA